MINKGTMKAKLKRTLHSPYLPLFALWVMLQTVFLSVPLIGGDEVYYGSVLQNESLMYFLKRHYYTWSPRTLIEIVEVYVSTWSWVVWRFLHPTIVTIGVFALSRIINSKKHAYINWFLTILILLYHWKNMSTAGWISTTLVYVWPAIACVVAFAGAVQAFNNVNVKWWLGLATLLILLYGTNMEQTMFVYLAAIVFLIGYKLITRAKTHWLLWAQAMVALANGVYIAICPGEHARYINDVTSWFKNFGMLSIFTKMEIGLVFSGKNLIFAQNYIFTIFCFIICLVIFTKHKDIIYRALALYPLCISLVMGFFSPVIDKITNIFALIKGQTVTPYYINMENANEIKSYVAFLIICSVLGIIIANLYIALGHNKASVFAIIAFALGYASYGAMGFAPTVSISGMRTGFLCEMIIIAITVVLFKEIKNYKTKYLYVFYALLLPCIIAQMHTLFVM